MDNIWHNIEDWLETRLTISLDNEVINSVDHGFEVYPCHSQAVEHSRMLANPRERVQLLYAKKNDACI